MAVLIFFLLIPALAFADFSGQVVKVQDGDTLTVRTHNQQTIKVRVNGIDAPERTQPHGHTAQQFTAELVTGHTVTIIDHGLDRYHRTIGDVLLADGRSLAQELLQAGLAWWFYKYSNDAQLGQLELTAKLAHIGLWHDPNPVPPWIYRTVKPLLH